VDTNSKLAKLRIRKSIQDVEAQARRYKDKGVFSSACADVTKDGVKNNKILAAFSIVLIPITAVCTSRLKRKFEKRVTGMLFSAVRET
jgi:hypothetical protein